MIFFRFVAGFIAVSVVAPVVAPHLIFVMIVTQTMLCIDICSKSHYLCTECK